MPSGTALHDRLRSVAGQRSYRDLSSLTDTNPETVRRYMTGQAPSVEFVTAFCRVFRVNHEWLLTGKGPARAKDLRGAVLSEASVSELLDALARSLEQLTERVERLERFIHTMETRLRAGSLPGAGGGGGRVEGEAGARDGRQASTSQSDGAGARFGVANGDGSGRGGVVDERVGPDRHAVEASDAASAGDASVCVRAVADAVAAKRPRQGPG